MGEVISLKDGKVETLFETRDFQYLVAKYMGFDAEHWFMELVEELQEAADETTQKIDTDLTSYEASLESNTRAFQDILEHLAAMDNLLDGSRMNRLKLVKEVEAIKTLINNQI